MVVLYSFSFQFCVFVQKIFCTYPHSCCSVCFCLNIFLMILTLLTLPGLGGGQSDPRVHKSACYGRKTKKNPNLGHGKCPPHSPQPHLHPAISSYIQCEVTQRLWSQLIVYFHLISSYTHVRVKKPLKSPVRVGIIQQYIGLNPTETGLFRGFFTLTRVYEEMR